MSPRCPMCSCPVRHVYREGRRWTAHPCGDDLTDDQAMNIRIMQGKVA